MLCKIITKKRIQTNREKVSMRSIRSVIVAIAFIVSALLGVNAVNPSVAGAQADGQIVPCPGSPYGNGWFDTWTNNGVHGSVNCSIQWNHIVVDVYNSQFVRTQAVIDMWYGSPCDHVTFVQPSYGQPFKIKLRNDTYMYSQSSGCGTYGPYINATSYGTWYSSFGAMVNQTVWQCHVLASRTCGYVDGFTVVRTNGINGGPYTWVGFSGYSGAPYANGFATDIYPFITS